MVATRTHPVCASPTARHRYFTTRIGAVAEFASAGKACKVNEGRTYSWHCRDTDTVHPRQMEPHIQLALQGHRHSAFKINLARTNSLYCRDTTSMHPRQIKAAHTAGTAETQTQCIQNKFGPHKQFVLQGHNFNASKANKGRTYSWHCRDTDTVHLK
jgi:hypothetical protein